MEIKIQLDPITARVVLDSLAQRIERQHTVDGQTKVCEICPYLALSENREPICRVAGDNLSLQYGRLIGNCGNDNYRSCERFR